MDTEVDWSALTSETTVGGLDTADAAELQSTSYATSATWDALRRPVTRTTPDNSVTRDTYNEAGLLLAVDVQVRGSPTWTPFVRSVDYNARAQRTAIVYAKNPAGTDGAFTTTYTYDPETFRLTRLRTTREPGRPGRSAGTVRQEDRAPGRRGRSAGTVRLEDRAPGRSGRSATRFVRGTVRRRDRRVGRAHGRPGRHVSIVDRPLQPVGSIVRQV